MLVCFGTPVSAGKDGDKNVICYCAILLNGKIRLAVDGKQVYTDIKLSLRRKITIEGVLIYPDGSKIFLKNGECVNQ